MARTKVAFTVSAGEAAQALNISVRTLRSRIAAGTIRTVRIGKERRVSFSEIRRLHGSLCRVWAHESPAQRCSPWRGLSVRLLALMTGRTKRQVYYDLTEKGWLTTRPVAAQKKITVPAAIARAYLETYGPVQNSGTATAIATGRIVNTRIASRRI